jgi:hypothetical protein
MASPLCLLPSFLAWCYNMAFALFPSFQFTSYFLQLSLLPGCLGSLQKIILVRGAQHGVPSVPPPPNKELKLTKRKTTVKFCFKTKIKLNHSGCHGAHPSPGLCEFSSISDP